MGRPRLLDLFCRAGGASAGYHAAGFEVVGVDIEPQPWYPFEFVQADALTVDLDGFDVLAASPPCQRYCAATPADRRDRHPDLIGPVRDRLRAALARPGGPWAYVIENVPGAPLLHPITVCGDALRLGVRRHRLFESNLPLAGTPCWHDRPTPPVAVYGDYARRTNPTQPPASSEAARAAMGIDWMPWADLTQAVPPAYTHWLGVQLLAHARRHGNLPARTGTARPAGDETPPAVKRHRQDENPSTSSTANRHCPCGQPLPERPLTGRWPRYCSHACRQAAYRARKATR